MKDEIFSNPFEGLSDKDIQEIDSMIADATEQEEANQSNLQDWEHNNGYEHS